DLGRADAVTRRGDDIVVAAHKRDVAVRVDDALIARRHPLADEFFARGVALAPILQEHHRVGALDRDLTELVGGAGRAVRPDHRDAMAGHWLADRARPRNIDRRAGGQHQVAFGLAVELVDGDAERRLAPFVGLGPERLAARADRA